MECFCAAHQRLWCCPLLSLVATYLHWKVYGQDFPVCNPPNYIMSLVWDTLLLHVKHVVVVKLRRGFPILQRDGEGTQWPRMLNALCTCSVQDKAWVCGFLCVGIESWIPITLVKQRSTNSLSTFLDSIHFSRSTWTYFSDTGFLAFKLMFPYILTNVPLPWRGLSSPNLLCRMQHMS